MISLSLSVCVCPYLHSSMSHSRVCILNSIVRLALVTSVQWTPPFCPPVKFWGNNYITFMIIIISKFCCLVIYFCCTEMTFTKSMSVVLFIFIHRPCIIFAHVRCIHLLDLCKLCRSVLIQQSELSTESVVCYYLVVHGINSDQQTDLLILPKYTVLRGTSTYIL